MRKAPLWIPILIAGLLGGCGQKGPLLLPDTPKHKKVASSPRAPAPPSGTAPASSTSATDAPGNPSDAARKP